MEQSTLRAWESKCVQEETPQCSAACPLHVDVRSFCRHAEAGKWNEAWAILARTMPVPGVLSRICDAPCAKACIRSETGGAIRTNSLERACAELKTKDPRIMPLRSNGKQALILGAGMAGLTAASDLVRKGFTVTVHTGSPGGELWAIPQAILPDTILENELETLRKLGVRFLDADSWDNDFQKTVEQYSGVFIDSMEFPLHDHAIDAPDAMSLGTQLPGLFAAPDQTPDNSPVFRAAFGRRAASSIERFSQGASLTANREKEGPYATRLYTNQSKVAHKAPVEPSSENYTATEARQEAARCLRCECMECVTNCAYLEHFESYPKVYARRIYNNASIVMGTRMANTMVNSCMLCGLCEVLCPEDFAMQGLILDARQDLVRNDNMPPSAHDFALRDMAFASGPQSALTRHAPGQNSSTHAFFPGCQLAASDPEKVTAIYDLLCSWNPQTGLMLNCCGAPAHWAGRETLTAAHADSLKTQWASLGNPHIITACPSCMLFFREHLPDMTIQSLWELLDEQELTATGYSPASPLALHDPCSSRHDKPLQNAARNLLKKQKIAWVEPELSGEYTECCGFGGLLSEANPPLADVVARRRAEKKDEDYITYCAMCRDQLARTGKRILHVLDLFFPADADPAARPAPGYSQRRENRARLRQDLLQKLWNEQPEAAEDHERISITLTAEVAAKMEDRRILVSDVQKVLLAFEQSGKAFVHEDTGRKLAFLRPVVVTYWVEFEPAPDGGYIVHNVWHHRMHLKNSKGGSA